jgi:phenylalanyl-tRNA synthetase beta chain
VERELTAETLVIADERGPLAIAGVMGGAESEVTEQTRRVIVESAIFDPVSIRRTAFRYALRSEASLRFEKGQEHAMARAGADRTAALMLAWAGGRASVGVIDSAPESPPLRRIAFRPWRIDRLLGESIAPAEQRALLARVEVRTEPARPGDGVPIMVEEPPRVLSPDETAAALVAIVPGHRRDLAIEADIAEEIARVRGYETLAGRLPDTPMPAYRDDLRATDVVRAILAGAGLAEVVTHGLVGPEDHARLGFGADDPTTIRAANPVTLDHSELRRSLIPEHLRIVADNERQRDEDVRAFEIGVLHEWRAGRPTERDVLGLVLTGRDRPLTYDRPSPPIDLATAKGLLELLVARLAHSRLTYEPADIRAGIDHPGRTATVVRVVLGRVGELHPALLERSGVRAEHVLHAEIDLRALAGLRPERLRVGRLHALPGIDRDIAVVVPASQAAGALEAVIREQGGVSLRSVQLFDRYRGAPLAHDEVSLAYRLRFEAVDAAFSEGEVDAAVERVVGVLNERLGARLRA